MENIAQAFRERPGVILLLVGLGFVGPTLVFIFTLGVTLWQTPVYEASAKLVVGQKRGVPQDSDLVNNARLQDPLALLVVEAIDSRPVAEEVIRRLGLKGMKPAELLENLSVEPDGGGFLQLSYKDTDPQRAQQIVNTIGVVSSERVAEAIGGANDVVVTMYEDASVPGSPVSPDPVRNAALALILGLMVGPVLAMVLAIWMDERASRS
jgi:capsular polysaccharide biosynthesis protein